MFAKLDLDSHPRLLYLLLFFMTMLFVAVGIGEITGITGKDEYFLSLRTPLTMFEQDRWWIPWLDEAPRLKKPPMLYWLARMSFEVFGPSLISARIVAVGFAALLALLTALIAYELGHDRRYALTAGIVAASTLALAVEGRRLMLDVPCATFSALAFYGFLRWYRHPAWWRMLLAATALAAGFLTKGPLVIMLFGSGVAALFLLQPSVRRQLWQDRWQLLSFVVIFLALALPWYVYVLQQFPNMSSSMLEEDAQARELWTFSGAPLSALVLVVFPWSFVLLRALFGYRSLRQRLLRFNNLLPLLLLWLALSLLPFFGFKSFVRYMAGSVVPMSLLVAVLLVEFSPHVWRWWLRLGMVLATLLASAFIVFAWWFTDAKLAVVLTAIVLIGFVIVWWRARSIVALGLSAALMWTVLLGVLYPRLGVNAIPAEVLAIVDDKPVIYFNGPQPAMLSGAKARAYVRTKRLQPHHLQQAVSPLIFAPVEYEPLLRKQLRALDVRYVPRLRFQTLSSRGAWLNFARKGATRADWDQAVATHSLTPLQATIVLYAAEGS